MSDAAREAFFRAVRTAKAAPKQRRAQRRGGELTPLHEAMQGFVHDQGWQGASAFATIAAQWGQIVGADFAQHVTPTRCVEGTLVVQAESTAWATQVRMLIPQMQEALATVIGPDVVHHIEVLGPATPIWVKGPRRVKGRGPRDTYG